MKTTYNIKSSQERMMVLIKQFERALATGQSLESVRDELRRQADNTRLERYAEIERCYQSCQLILFGITEPANSTAGGIARGYVKKCKKEYRESKEGQEQKKILHALNVALTENKQKGQVNDDDTDKDKECAQSAGSELHSI